jgi:hypothetical protein
MSKMSAFLSIKNIFVFVLAFCLSLWFTGSLSAYKFRISVNEVFTRNEIQNLVGKRIEPTTQYYKDNRARGRVIGFIESDGEFFVNVFWQYDGKEITDTFGYNKEAFKRSCKIVEENEP